MTTQSETPEKPGYNTESWGQALVRTFKWIVIAVACVVGFTMVGAFLIGGFQKLEQNGYISHDRTLEVYMTGNWMVGENRICWLSLQYDANEKPTGELGNLQCPIGSEKPEPHNLTVTFKGIVSPKDVNGFPQAIPDQWRCTRSSEKLTCDPMATQVNAPTQ